MVCGVVRAAKGPYAKFIGNLYTDPRVNGVCDEGRSFLRHTDHRYDVIQIHSNHTTSSVAQGACLAVVYSWRSQSISIPGSWKLRSGRIASPSARVCE